MSKRISVIRPHGKIAFVLLYGGKQAVIDASDASLVQGHYWKAVKNSNGNQKVCATIDGQTVYLHRLISEAQYGIDKSRNVYHLDGNGLDNRRANLVVPYVHLHLKEKLAKARKKWKKA